MGFQTVVNQQPAPAVAGDFASANPRASVATGPGAFVAGVGGCNVGVFGWADADGNVTNSGSGAPTGFVHREGQALITAWLAQSGMTIPEGVYMTLMSAGDFWAKSTTAATPGQQVFANEADGSIYTAAAGSTPPAPETAQGYIANNMLIFAAAPPAEFVPGAVISAPGLPPGVALVVDNTGGGGTSWTLSQSVPNLGSSSSPVTFSVGGSYAGTKWVVAPGASCNAGELVKITSWS